MRSLEDLADQRSLGAVTHVAMKVFTAHRYHPRQPQSKQLNPHLEGIVRVNDVGPKPTDLTRQRLLQFAFGRPTKELRQVTATLQPLSVPQHGARATRMHLLG